jgi:8-oxo-dGTP pyrophosphatase MutT (NUDIX family)
VWHAEQAASFQEYLRKKRGDDSYVADPSWPFKPTEESNSFVDTQPIPPLPPRPGNVPVLDFSPTGVLQLEIARGEAMKAEVPTFNSEAYRRAPRPQLADRVEASPSERGADLSRDSSDLSVAELVEGFPQSERDLPDTDDTQVVEQLSVDPLELVEPVAASDAVGEPEPDDAPTPGPPPAVLRVAAAIITDPDGRCLLVRKAGTTAFMQAGGKLEPGESAVDALARELQEELGLELDDSTAEYLGVFRAEAPNEPNTVVSAAVFAFETASEVQARGEIEELLWIDGLDGIDAELAPLTREELLPLWAARRASSTLF